jgi:hypothetical protein
MSAEETQDNGATCLEAQTPTPTSRYFNWTNPHSSGRYEMVNFTQLSLKENLLVVEGFGIPLSFIERLQTSDDAQAELQEVDLGIAFRFGYALYYVSIRRKDGKDFMTPDEFLEEAHDHEFAFEADPTPPQFEDHQPKKKTSKKS